jgi:hypothetical protein
MNVVRESEDGPGFAGPDARSWARAREADRRPIWRTRRLPRFGQLLVPIARTEANCGSVAAADPTERRGRRERGAPRAGSMGTKELQWQRGTFGMDHSRSAAWKCCSSTRGALTSRQLDFHNSSTRQDADHIPPHAWSSSTPVACGVGWRPFGAVNSPWPRFPGGGQSRRRSPPRESFVQFLGISSA